jgi:hypothetical protein
MIGLNVTFPNCRLLNSNHITPKQVAELDRYS